MAPADLLADALRARRTLLVLDNCEHLVDQVAKLAAELLQSAPELRIVVTSREPLMLAGEVVWAVPPLELPDPASRETAAVERFSAVRLFVARAAASVPGFALDEGNAEAVAELCRRLDGIPLALELAATRVRSLGVHELLTRLDDRFRLLATGHRDAPPRQQTLWAVIDWSWELLPEPERAVLRRLAVAAAGCGLPAAEAICAEDDLDVLGLLARLVDRSLVIAADGPDGPRYRLLESVAAYSLQRLSQAGEYARIRRRHRQYYGDLAERAAARLRGRDQRSALRRLDADNANLRGALDGAIEDGDASAALALSCALAWYWLLRGRLTEAQRTLDAALALNGGPPGARATAAAWRSGFAALAGQRRGDAPPPSLDGVGDPGTRAILEWFHAFAASDFGDPAVAETLASDALARFRALGDQWGMAAALSTGAKVAMIRGDRTAAKCAARDSLAIFRELGDRWGQLQAIEWLGAALASVDPAQAARLHRDGLRIAEELGLWPQAADALSWLGLAALHAGDLVQARELLERGRRLAAEQSYRPGQVFAELGLGQTARLAGQLDLAEAHLRSVLGASLGIGSEPDVARVVSLAELGFVAEYRGEPDVARSYHLRSLASAAKLGDPEAVAQALIGLAGAHALGGGQELAAQLLGAADTAARGGGASLPPGDGPDAARVTAVTRQALGEAAFAAEFARGQRLGPEQAAALLRAAPVPSPPAASRQRPAASRQTTGDRRAPPGTRPGGGRRTGGRERHQSMTPPPVRLISVPVMVAAQPDAANTAALATSW
jgi:predicted ATPase